MIIYVSHCFGGKPQNLERAKKITHDLQVADLENTYICPLLALSHLKYNEDGYDEEMNLKEIGAVLNVSESRSSQLLSQLQ